MKADKSIVNYKAETQPLFDSSSWSFFLVLLLLLLLLFFTLFFAFRTYLVVRQACFDFSAL